MRKLFIALFALTLHFTAAHPAHAFCGFYVAKGDTKLFNKASKVALVRDENRTVITMANDFKGNPKEFAIVVPVPTFIQREQIHVTDPAIIDHLDAYSAPRLVEYFDPDPCAYRYDEIGVMDMMRAPAAASKSEVRERAKGLGVKIEAEYTVGEYDILILSAQQSSGLETWLRENGYTIPNGASEILASYIRQNIRFFVAKVNLEEQSKLGFSYLRPLQIAFESPKFMLPIRLGTVNADGPQDLFVFTLTRRGRVETTNYRTVRLREGMDIPTYIKNDFGNFYQAAFSEAVRKESMRAVFLEYAWDMGWCDPCASDPLSNQELRELGVFWIDQPQTQYRYQPPIQVPQNVYLTRLHVRYDGAHFPEDLTFQETSDRTNFQARYVLRHPYKGGASCPAMQEYERQVRSRQEREAESLASLTGWSIDDIRRRMDFSPVHVTGSSGSQWWRELWK